MSARHHALNRARWAACRHTVFERDGWRCRHCGRAGRLECDHVTPLWKWPQQDPYDPDGCQSLCKGCHTAKTRDERQRTRTAAEDAWTELVAELD